MRRLFISLAMVFLFGAGAAASPANGELAPDFKGLTMNGENVRLSDFRGRSVVLEWTNHECPYVRKHYGSGNMQRTQRALTEDGAVWISIISSAAGKQGHVTAPQAQRLTAERGVYADLVILDPEGEIGRLYAAKTTPHMFIVDENGILQYQGAIDDKPSANLRSLEGAKNYVLAAWHELQSDRSVTDPQTKPYGCSVKYPD